MAKLGLPRPTLNHFPFGPERVIVAHLVVLSRLMVVVVWEGSAVKDPSNSDPPPHDTLESCSLKWEMTEPFLCCIMEHPAGILAVFTVSFLSTCEDWTFCAASKHSVALPTSVLQVPDVSVV